MAKEKFEDALSKLEKIVSQMEEGEIPLEESLKLFEEGIRLSRYCNQKLDEAEKKVEILVRDREGTLKPQPFAPSAEVGGSSMDSSDSNPPDSHEPVRSKGGGFLPGFDRTLPKKSDPSDRVGSEESHEKE